MMHHPKSKAERLLIEKKKSEQKKREIDRSKRKLAEQIKQQEAENDLQAYIGNHDVLGTH